MDENKRLLEEQNNKEIKEQGVPSPETAEASQPVANIPAPKAPMPKLPLIIGGAVAGVAAIAVAVALILGGGKHEHSFGAWNIVDAPTCLAAGIEERVCECGDKETRSVAALGHTEVIDVAVEATCSSTGLTEGKHCSKCSKVFVAQNSVAMKSHTEVTDVAVEATCYSTGLTEGKHCSVCNETLVAQKVVDALSHTEVTDEAVAATCTTTGLTEGMHCAVCSTILLKQEETDATGEHNFIDHECSNCDALLSSAGLLFETNSYGGYTLVNAYDCTDEVIYVDLYDGKPVTMIGYEAFKYSSAKKVIMGKSVTEIGNSAFAYCGTLEEIQIGDSVTDIDSKAFYNCPKIKTITIPDSVKIIGRDVFWGCKGLEKVEIGTGVEKIFGGAFHNCTNLKGVYIKDLSAYCKIYFESFNISNPLYYAGNLYLNNELLTELIIPDDVTYIYNGFYHCTSITEVTMGKNVENFYNDSEYTESPFIGCPNITSIEVDSDNTFLVSKGNCLIDKVSKKIIAGCGNSQIPDDGSARIIGRYAFSYIEDLYSIVIPSTIKGIENYAFASCNNLTSVELPDGLTEISGSTFYNCSKLESLVIPASVIYTGYDATYKCYKLKIILYKGTPEDWQNIEMKKNSDCSSVYQIPLCTAKRYYYSETLPVDNGNYWHYVDGVPTIWE